MTNQPSYSNYPNQPTNPNWDGAPGWNNEPGWNANASWQDGPYGDPGPGGGWDNPGYYPPPRRKGPIIALIAVIAVIAVAIAGTIIYFVTRDDSPPAAGTDGALKEKFAVSVGYTASDNPDHQTYGRYWHKNRQLYVFAPNGTDKWTANIVDVTTGKVTDTVTDLPQCDPVYTQPLIIDGGKIVCATTMPPEFEQPDAVDLDDMELAGFPDDFDIDDPGDIIFANDDRVVFAWPNVAAARRVFAVDFDVNFLWERKFDPPARVASDGYRVWAITDDKDAQQSTIVFNEEAGSEDKQIEPAEKFMKDSAPAQPKKKSGSTPKQAGNLKDFDFNNMYLPWHVDGSCWPPGKRESVQLEVMPSGPTDCWTKMSGGSSDMLTFPSGPGDQHWEDLNGDGITDTWFYADGYGMPQWFAVIANPDDPAHPYVGFIATADDIYIEYLGGGTWRVNSGDGTGPTTTSLNGDGGVG